MSTVRPRPAHRARLAGAAVAAGTLAAVVVTGCGAAGATGGTTDAAASPAAGSPTAAAPTAPVLARAGGLEIAAGFVPAPASPDVAAAYFTIVNTGDTPDTLEKAASDASATTTLHRTEGGSMVAIDSLPVPADGTAAFSPGADHLMLDDLTRTLAKGDRVTLTLSFASAGTVTVTLPVTGYPTGGTVPSEALSPLPSPGAS